MPAARSKSGMVGEGGRGEKRTKRGKKEKFDIMKKFGRKKNNDTKRSKKKEGKCCDTQHHID